jgi:membrane dipeptidase
MTSLLAFVLLCGFGANDVYLERARELHAKYPLIDGHNDLPWRMRNLDRINPMSLDISKRLDDGQTDIPRLREGGVGAQFWSVYIPVSLQGEQAVQTTKEQIYLVYRLARTYPDDFEIAWTANDVERIFAKGKIASLIGMEGGHSINSSIETLREMYRLGARYMTLTHSSNTPWADSATDEPQHNGLTEFGKEIVREMNRLGMLVDLSHVSAKTMHDTLDIAEAPVIFSHSGAMAVCDHVRNVPDDVLLRLKKKGGVVMVVIFRPYNSQKYKDWSEERRKYQQELSAKGMAQNEIQQALRNWEKEKPAPDATLSDVADHIDHIKKVAGIDHIGIGSDFDGGGGVTGLEDVSKLPYLTAELLRRGYSENEIAKILGLNVLRVMRSAEQVAEKHKMRKAG